MNLALDYDDTYTRDMQVWDNFITLLKQKGHNVYCVTMRYPEEGFDVVENLHGKVDGIYFTGRLAKQPFMFKMGISIDVWVDDNPHFILLDAKG